MKQRIGDPQLAKSSGRKAIYVPNQGDIVWASLDDPPVGHEQGGHRRVLVVSPLAYNRLTSKALAFPITTRVKGYKFEVLIPDGMSTKGVILSSEIKSIDWKARNFEFIEKAPEDIVKGVIAQFVVLLPYLDEILEEP